MKIQSKMKYFSSIVLFAVLFSSCQKDDNKLIYESIPFVPNHHSYVLEINEDSSSMAYTYNTTWKIQEIQTFNNSIPLEKIVFTTNGNAVKKTSNKNNYIYTYYLNKKGYADSTKISKIGYVSLTEYYKYNNLGYVIEKQVVGEIVNVPYLEVTTFTYENSNLIKAIQTNDGEVFTSDYTYYTDSLNILAGTDEATLFIPQSKNLIKRISNSDDTFIDFEYSLDDDGNFLVNSINQIDESKQKVYKIQYLK